MEMKKDRKAAQKETRIIIDCWHHINSGFQSNIHK